MTDGLAIQSQTEAARLPWQIDSSPHVLPGRYNR